MKLSSVCNKNMTKYIKEPLSKTHSKYFLDLLHIYDEKLADILYYGAISYNSVALMVGTEYGFDNIFDSDGLSPKDLFNSLISSDGRPKTLLDIYHISNKNKYDFLFIPVLVNQKMIFYACTPKKSELLSYLNLFTGEEIYEKYPVLISILNWGITYMIPDTEKEHLNDILATEIEQSRNYIQVKSSIVNHVFKEKWLPYASALHTIASWNYEHQANYGYIDFEEPLLNKEQKLQVKFEEPLLMSAHKARTIRKYVELSNDLLRLKAESLQGYIIGANIPDDIYWHFVGLGEKNEECYATVRFEGKSSWRMFLGNESIFYDGSTFSLQREHKKEPEYVGATIAFYREIERVTNTYDENVVKNINSIIDMASQQLHGTMIVFSPKAQEEAERLCHCGRGIKVEPINFPEVIKEDEKRARQIMYNLTKIDGSMLFDENGICYSIGTIVDGRACENSNPGRGARYNSGYTYVFDCNMREIQCYCIVISEDETIDVFGQFGKTLTEKIKKTYEVKG